MKRQSDWPVLLLVIALLFGGLVRFMPASMTRFPINDGGMFLDMTRDLRANHYLLPAATTYNGLDLPYAYPPLGFYIASLLADLTRIPLLDLFLWLPPLLSMLTIFAFYLFARALLGDNLRAALASVFFALTPGGYDWHVMGGGITRSLGLVFLLLAARQVYLAFRSESPSARKTLLAALFCALAVLSHPEVAIQTAGLCALLWLFHGRTRRGLLYAFFIAIGTLLLTAPWWATVLAQHGAAPFLSASQTGLHTTAPWSKFFVESYTGIGIFPLLLILRLAGTAYAFVKREWLLLSMLILPYLVDPRSAPAIAFLGFSLLSALVLLDALPILIARWRKAPPKPLTESRVGVVLLFALFFLQFVDCGLNNYRLINTTLTPGDREAMSWINENIPPRRNFLLLTGRPYSMSDPVQEWFPTLAGQHSQTTLQGLEWTLGAEFNSRLEALAELQSCAELACVESWSARTGLTYDHLWIGKTSASLEQDLRASKDYRIIYESETAVVFARAEQ